MKILTIQEVVDLYGTQGNKNKCKTMKGNLNDVHIKQITKILKTIFKSVIFDDDNKKGRKRRFIVDDEYDTPVKMEDMRLENGKEKTEMRIELEKAFADYLINTAYEDPKEKNYLTDSQILTMLSTSFEHRLIIDFKNRIDRGVLKALHMEDGTYVDGLTRTEYVSRLHERLRQMVSSVYHDLERKGIIVITTTMICRTMANEYVTLPLEETEEILMAKSKLFEKYGTNEFEVVTHHKADMSDAGVKIKKCQIEINKLFSEKGYRYGYLGRKFILNASKKKAKDYIDEHTATTEEKVRESIANQTLKNAIKQYERYKNKPDSEIYNTKGSYGEYQPNGRKEEIKHAKKTGKYVEDTKSFNDYYFKGKSAHEDPRFDKSLGLYDMSDSKRLEYEKIMDNLF